MYRSINTLKADSVEEFRKSFANAIAIDQVFLNLASMHTLQRWRRSMLLCVKTGSVASNAIQNNFSKTLNKYLAVCNIYHCNISHTVTRETLTIRYS